jgi:hypothetical protein
LSRSPCLMAFERRTCGNKLEVSRMRKKYAFGRKLANGTYTLQSIPF